MRAIQAGGAELRQWVATVTTIGICMLVANTCSGADVDGRLGDELRQVLDAGLVEKARLAEVGRHFEQVRLHHPGDPRVHFAYGLVLQSRLRRDQAADEFAAAIRADRSFGPAWQSLIMLRLARKSADRLCDLIVGLTETLAKDELDWGATERHDLAAWLGRVHGFLLLDEVDIVPADALEHNLAIVGRRLPGELLSDYEAGRERLRADYDERLTEVELAIARDESAAAQQEKSELESLEDRRDEVQKKAETLKLTREQWISWLKDQLETSTKRLNELKEDYQKLESADSSLIALQLQAQSDRQRLQTEYSLQGLAAAGVARQPGVIRIEQEVLRYENERLSLKQQAARVQATARNVVLARIAATRRYERATGDLQKTDETLTTWYKSIDRSSLKVKEKAAGTENKRRAHIRRLSLPATYFDWNETAAAKRMLRQLGTSLAGNS